MRLIDAHMSLCNSIHSLGVVQIVNAEREKRTNEGIENRIKTETTKKVKIEMERNEKRKKMKNLEPFPLHSQFTIRNSLNITTM